MRNNCFTFLRYLFALCIFCNHLCYTTGRDIFLCNGIVFVCGFFAMSGFLNFNSYRQTPSPPSFAKKRFKRIYPAYSLTILFGVALGACLTTWPLADFLRSSQTWRYLLANLLFLNYLQPSLPGVFEGNVMNVINSSLWTMKVEVLFYISVPIVYWLMKRFGENKTLLCIIVGSLLYNYLTEIAYQRTGNRIFYTLNHQIVGELSYFYIPVLMLCNTDWVKKHGKPLAWLSGTLVALFIFHNEFRYILPLALPVFVITFAYECRWLLFTAGWKDYSYEFYLLRFPVLQAVVSLGLATTLLGTALWALPLTCILAYPLHHISKAISDRI